MTSLCLDILSSVVDLSAICISSGAFLDFNILTPSHPDLRYVLINYYYDNDDFTCLYKIRFICRYPCTYYAFNSSHFRVTLGNNFTLDARSDARGFLGWGQETFASPLMESVSPSGPGGWLPRCILGQPLTVCHCLCSLIWVCPFQLLHTGDILWEKCAPFQSFVQQTFFSIDLE